MEFYTSVAFLVLFTLVLLFMGLAPKAPRKRQKRISNPPVIVPVDSPEQIPFPRRLRRAQQALIRQEKAIGEKLKDVSHQRNELAIGNLLLELGEKHLTIQDEGLVLKTQEKAFELIRQKAVFYNEQQLTHIENARKSVEMDRVAFLNDQERARNQIRSELLDVQKEHLAVNQAGLDNVLGEIKNRQDQLELKDREIDLHIKDGLATLRHKEVDLRKMNLMNIQGAIDNKIGQLSNQEQRVKLAYLTAQEGLKSVLRDIVNQQKKLELMRFENKLDNRKEHLDLYHYRLQSWEQHINQMYQVRLENLKIEARTNQLDYREQELKLNRKYNDTMDQIEKLKLNRWENDLVVREKELELKKLAKSIQRFWLN